MIKYLVFPPRALFGHVAGERRNPAPYIESIQCSFGYFWRGFQI
jgi:hypothetical protein